MAKENVDKINDNNDKILKLQRQYEAGIIKEEELTPEEKEKLTNLYKSQIEILQKNIEESEKNLTIYKEKIINIKNKI